MQCLGPPPPKHSHVGAEQQGIPKAKHTQTCLPLPAPPRVQLVPGHRGLRCAGVVEFYNGSRGGTILYKAKDRPLGLGNLICDALQCGSFLAHMSEPEAAETPAPEELTDPKPLPIRWEARNASCASMRQCFQKTSPQEPQEGGQALSVICSGKLETEHTPSGHLLPWSGDVGCPIQMSRFYERPERG